MLSPTILKHTIAFILTCLSGATAFCQTDTLALSSAVASPGSTVSLNLSVTSPAGSEPAGIEWTLAYSPSDITAVSAIPGASANAAVKFISCAPAAGSYTCLLTGLDTTVMQNGVAAIVNVTLAPATTATTITVKNAMGVSPAGSAITMAATGGTITTSSPLVVTLLSCNPGTVNSGASSACTATLNQAAPTGGASVALASNNPALGVPSAVTVAAGAAAATFTATAGTVTTSQTAAITAALNGTSQTFTLNLVAPLTISTLACNPTNLNAGASSTCAVTLSAPAPNGGVTLLLSENGTAVTAPSSLTVPASSSTATFPVTAASVTPSGEETVIVTATLNGASQAVSFIVMCPCSVWSATAQPLNPASTSNQAVEVGMKFSSAASGYVTGVRFYKGSSNKGTHVGNLWSSTGQLLASVTFQHETASGWQTAYFAAPVAITANTTYVISYHAPQGHTAADNGFFTGGGVSNAPLQALADGQSGPNGVYADGSGGFPATGSSATNYWVDVVFNIAPTVGTAAPVSLWAPAAVPGTPAANVSQPTQLGLRFDSNVPGYVTGVRFYKSSKNTGSHTGYLWTATGTLLGSVIFTNESASGWQQANFAAPIAIQPNTMYVISYCALKGHYADDAGYFATSGVTNEMLYAPVDGQYGPNGVYATTKGFPTGTSGSSNYWVDVVFTTEIQ